MLQRAVLTHAAAAAAVAPAAVNKQLNDKERVAAALENGALLDLLNRCIAHTDRVDAVAALPW